MVKTIAQDVYMSGIKMQIKNNDEFKNYLEFIKNEVDNMVKKIKNENKNNP